MTHASMTHNKRLASTLASLASLLGLHARHCVGPCNLQRCSPKVPSMCQPFGSPLQGADCRWGKVVTVHILRPAGPRRDRCATRQERTDAGTQLTSPFSSCRLLSLPPTQLMLPTLRQRGGMAQHPAIPQTIRSIESNTRPMQLSEPAIDLGCGGKWKQAQEHQHSKMPGLFLHETSLTKLEPRQGSWRQGRSKP